MEEKMIKGLIYSGLNSGLIYKINKKEKYIRFDELYPTGEKKLSPDEILDSIRDFYKNILFDKHGLDWKEYEMFFGESKRDMRKIYLNDLCDIKQKAMTKDQEEREEINKLKKNLEKQVLKYVKKNNINVEHISIDFRLDSDNKPYYNIRVFSEYMADMYPFK